MASKVRKAVRKKRPKKSVRKVIKRTTRKAARSATPKRIELSSLVGSEVSARIRSVTSGSNGRLLDAILGGHFPDDTKLDPPFDGPARAGLAARIQRAGVPVSSAAVIACATVGCVRREMNRANPAGR